MSRIDLEDDLLTASMKMTDGNSGASAAIGELRAKWPTIDPQSAMGHFTPIMFLDTLEIYGQDIWVLWKDCCRHEAKKFAILLRGNQLGLIDCYSIKQASLRFNHGTPIEFDWDDLLSKIKLQVPEFNQL